MQTSLNVDKNGKYINIKANLGMAITPGTEVADNFPQDAMLWVGGAGNLELLLRGNKNTIILKGVAAGTYINFLDISKVVSTGTTATFLVALWQE